jgi:Xaa-Pro aminopeptidase
MECPDYELIEWRSRWTSPEDAAAGIASARKLKSIAFEEDYITYGRYKGLRDGCSAELVPTVNIIEELRSIKNEKELSYQRAACDISCRAFERILQDIRVGITEKELAALLSYYMVAEGADTQPYGNILISGARTSLLHGIPSSKAVEYGDFVLMDYGCQYNGYMSDMTRTVVVGKASEKQRQVYDLEYKMVQESLKAMKSGAAVKDVYSASIKPIEGTEYFNYHYQGIGHGIGLFVHELPFIGPRHEYVFKENQVTTIEPGIYIPGWGGVRIEDQVVITKDGYENLVTAPKELIEL